MIPKQIIIHHSASGFNTTVDQINEWHKVKFNFVSSLGDYVGYHYVIDVSGKTYQTRRDNELGAHCPPNDGRIGICLIGNFEISEPTDAQLTTLLKVVEALKKTYNITEVWGHRDCLRTECPGVNLQKYVVKLTELNRLQRWLAKLLMPKPNV